MTLMLRDLVIQLFGHTENDPASHYKLVFFNDDMSTEQIVTSDLNTPIERKGGFLQRIMIMPLSENPEDIVTFQWDPFREQFIRVR